MGEKEAFREHLKATAPREELVGEIDRLERELARREQEIADREPVLGHCPHGVDLDRAFCSEGCRV